MWPTPDSTRLTRFCVDGEMTFEVAGAGTLLQQIAARLGDLPDSSRTILARVLLDAVVLDSVVARRVTANARAGAANVPCGFPGTGDAVPRMVDAAAPVAEQPVALDLEAGEGGRPEECIVHGRTAEAR